MTDNSPIDIRRLETAEHPETLRRIAIEPLTRVEGHGKVTLLLDDDNRIRQARLHIVEFRGFEKFIQGRPYWELPVLVQRLCGICPVSHHLAAGKAIDQLAGVDRLTPTAEKVRRLMHYGQILQSHALHFFHLSSPDLLFGFDSDLYQRNVVGLISRYPDLAKQGVLLRKFGQEVIRVTAGKRIHGTCAIPGGVNKSLDSDERDYLQQDIRQMIDWGQGALELARRLFLEAREQHRQFARINTPMLSLCRDDGALELYHGGLRALSSDGQALLDHIDYREYHRHIREQVKSWSYMKFPYLQSQGPETGAYRVGPLARINTCDFIDTPLAEQARVEFRALEPDGLVQSTLAYHWARMIELLHCAEKIEQLLADPDLLGQELKQSGDMRPRGIGVIEAPRGTLIHDYEINPDGLVTRANLIVSTTHNNRAMNESVRTVAADLFNGREITEGMLNQIEVAVRAYDPCLSCATHALGKMPLVIELQTAQGHIVDRLIKNTQGELSR
ncbi:Ni/Fe hydrogenase subunit alpha [Sedimenticola sp.]|uniref:Ni/Fe hydrogenase subunit alpha n=1 Tax=Sedimenticola sp. TaxID=1940285 RepID=UPI003D10BD9E